MYPRIAGVRRVLAAGLAVWAVGCTLDVEGSASLSGGMGAGPATGGGGGSVDGGGSGGSAAVGGSDSGGAGGASGAGSEDCFNSIDDDNDLRVDCLDTDCTNTRCVPAAPPGFSGYFRIKELDYSTTPPAATACPDGSTPARANAEPNLPATCAACSCGALSGAVCQETPLLCDHGGLSCTGSPTDDTSKVAGGCWNGPDSVTWNCTAGGTSSVISTGTCGSTQTGVTNPDVWKKLVDVCSFSRQGAGCNGGACVENGGDYSGFICVKQDGDVNCPAPWSTRVVTYSGATDTRGCSDCQCQPGTVTCSSTVYRAYGDDNCSDGLIGHRDIKAGSCAFLDGLTFTSFGWSMKKLQSATASGGCVPSGGGEPVGGIQPSGAVTYCCQAGF